MPFVEIFTAQERPVAARRALADAVHDALVETVGIPRDDRFQALLPTSELIYDVGYLGVERSPAFTLVRVTLRRGRSTELKRALYRAIVHKAQAATGLRPEDVLVVLVENDAPDWSFGGGIAHYAPET